MFIHDWTKKDLLKDFQISEDEIKDCKILLAYYSYEDYEGDAFVLLEKDGQLYEVNGSHCSCYGLEGQWNLESTNKESLMHRLENGRLGRSYGRETFAAQLRGVLNDL